MRVLLLGLTALLCLLLLLSGLLLFTSQGNQMIWQQLRSRVPGLQGELVAGQLGSGWEFADVGWQGEAIGFSARRLRLDWTATRLLQGELVVNRLSGEGVRLDLRYAQEPPTDLSVPPETAAVNSMLVLPLPIQLQQLQVRDFLLTSPDVRVQVDALDTAATWYGDSLHVQASQGAGVDVELLPGPASAAGTNVSPPPTDQASTPTPTSALVPLPEVFIPLAIELDELRVGQGRYHQHGFDTGLMDLRLSGNFTGTRLVVRQLSVNHAWGEAALSGQMIFEQYYGLKAELEANSQLPWLEGGLKRRQLKLRAEGDLGDLGFDLVISGPEKLKLDGRLSPLGEALPFSFKAHWQQLNWPLKGQAQYQAQAGKLSAEGSLENYRLQLDSAVKLPEFPAIKLALKLTGNLDEIALQHLRLTEGKTRLQAAGQLDWRDGVDWRGILALSSEDLARWRPELTGQLKGDTHSRFQWRQGGWQLALEQMQFSGVLNEYPLSLSGRLSGNDRQQWRFEQLSLMSGPNQLRLDGSLAERWDLRVRLDAPKLATLYPPLSGNLQASALISGPAEQPNVELDLTLPELQGQGVRVSDLSLKGSARLAPQFGGRLTLKARQVLQGENRMQDLQLRLDGDEAEHRLAFSFKGSPLAGQFAMDGSWQAGAWRGRLREAWLDTDMGRWALERPLNLASGESLADWQLGEHCWQSQGDRLCFEAARLSPEQGDLGFRLYQLTTARLKPWYPPRFSWQSRLQGQGRLGWQQGRPRLALSLETGPGVLVSDNLSSDYRMMSLNLQLDERRGELGLRFDSAALGQARLELGLEEPLGARRLNGNVTLENLRLYGIAPLVDELHRTTGRVDAKGRLAGTLDAPLFYGQVRLREGEIDTSQDLVSIRQLQALLNIDGTRADLQGSLRMGKGELVLRGFMDWRSGQPSGELNLSGTDLLVKLGGYGQARANPQLRLSFGQEMRLMGTVVIPRARIEVKSLPEDVVDVSEDVIIVRPQQSERVKAAPLPFYLNLKLLLGSDVRLTALGLKTRLTGSLDLTQRPGRSLSGRGQINLVEGRYKAYGQNLQIRSGRLLFSGNLAQPYLAVEAIRDPAAMEDDNVTVGVRVSGLASAPVVKLFSEPELSDTDKLSYLLRGKSSSATGSGSSNEAMTAMLLGAGLGQAGGVLSDITESLGLQDVTLDTAGSGADTQVSVSGKLLPGLQIQYGVGVFTSISEVKLRLELMPRLYLQAVSGLNQAVDLFYKFEF